MSRRVRKLPGKCVLVLLFALVLAAQPVIGKPWYDEQPHQVTFRSRICQPVPAADLKKWMGAAFDENKMAADLETAKRMFGSDLNDPETAGLQGDDPRVALVMDSTDLVEGEREWGSEEEEDEEEVRIAEEAIYTDNGVIDEIEERRTWVPRRSALDRRLSGRLSSSSSKTYRHHKHGLKKDEFGDDVDKKRKTVFSDSSYAYMRRRRRRSLEFTDGQPGRKSGDRDDVSPDEDDVNIYDDDDDYEDEDDEENDSKDKKSKDILPLRLILSGKNKKLRRQLKKKFRQKAKYLKKPPPWECEMKHTTLIMRDGVFPKYVQDGKCVNSKCFYRLYNCKPIQYAVKLMERDPDHCNPLPSLGNVTVFEESWNLVTHYATVGCNCVNANVKGKKRRRD